MIEISSKLFSKFNEANLLYCHWKSNEHLLPGLNGDTDLDILLSYEDKEHGELIMRDLDFLECKAQYGSRYPGVADWIGFDSPTGKLIHVHLHFHLVTGHKGMKEYNLPWTEEALSTRIIDSDTGVYIMEPNLEIITLYTRIGLKAYFRTIDSAHKGKFKLTKETQAEVDYLKDRVKWVEVERLSEKYYEKKSAEFIRIIKAKVLDSANFLSLITLTESQMKQNLRKESYSWIKKKYWLHWMKLRKMWNSFTGRLVVTKKTPVQGTGLVVAFLGQDGSGKSTISNDIKKWLIWKIEVNQFYLGSGDHWNPWQKKMLRLIPSISVFRPLRGLISLSQTMSLATAKLNAIKKAQEYKNLGGIALLDRFPQTIYKGINDGPRIRVKYIPIFGKGILRPLVERLANREEKKLEIACNMPPQIVFKLMLSPEESMRRKPFEKYDEVKKKHEIIKQLSFPDSEVYTIDATQPFEDELLQIKRIIWQHIPK